MSRIAELIKDKCPNGVQYCVLEDIADTFIGLATSVTKYKQSNGVILLHNSDIKQNKIVLKSTEFINKDFADKNKSKYNQLNDIITIHTGDVGTSAVITKEYVGSMGFTTLVTRIKDFNLVDPYFLCHYFNSDLCKRQIDKVTISDRSNLNQKEFCKLLIPVPPLEVQEEIVRILDKFTELEEELKEELEEELDKRRKQYEYYRNIILNSSENSNLKKLGDICDFVRGPFGGNLKKEMFVSKGYSVYEQQHAIYNNFNEFRYFVDEKKFNEMKRFKVQKGDLIMSCSGTMGKIAIIPDDAPEGIINQALLKLTPKEFISNKYLKYCFENSVALQMNSKARGGAIKNVASVDVLKNIAVRIPSLKEQKRIVSILDRFDKLCNDISQGISAEIEARKKQYEYYRDKLLTFKELKNE